MSKENGRLSLEKIVQIVLPILLTAFLAVLALLWNEIRDLRTECIKQQKQQAQEYGELLVKFARQEVVVKNLSVKIDAITETRFRRTAE